MSCLPVAEVHIVEEGETCKSIAKKYKIKCKDLLKHNQLSKGYVPVVCQILVLPRSCGTTVLNILNKHLSKVCDVKDYLVIAALAKKECGTLVPVAVVALSEKHAKKRICKKYELCKEDFSLHIKSKCYYVYDLEALEKFWHKEITLSLFQCSEKSETSIIDSSSDISQQEECHDIDEQSECGTESVSQSDSVMANYIRRTKDCRCPFSIRELQEGSFGKNSCEICIPICPIVSESEEYCEETCEEWSCVETTVESSEC